MASRAKTSKQCECEVCRSSLGLYCSVGRCPECGTELENSSCPLTTRLCEHTRALKTLCIDIRSATANIATCRRALAEGRKLHCFSNGMARMRYFLGAGADEFLNWWPKHVAHRAHMKTDIAFWHRALADMKLEGWYVQLLDGEEQIALVPDGEDQAVHVAEHFKLKVGSMCSFSVHIQHHLYDP